MSGKALRTVLKAEPDDGTPTVFFGANDPRRFGVHEHQQPGQPRTHALSPSRLKRIGLDHERARLGDRLIKRR